MKIPSFVLFYFIVQLLSAQKVASIYDGDYDFSGPKTYDWSPATKKKMKAFINVPYGSKEIMKHFSEYGYELSDEDPDLIVDIAIEQSKSMEMQKASTTRVASGSRNRRYRTGGANVNKPTLVQENTGTFTLKLINPKTQDAVWLASGGGTVEDDPEKRQKKVRKVIKKMFEKFPL